MNTTYLEYFAEVVMQKSINKASKNLNVSRTSIMSAISNLEKEIGFPLLIRTNKGVELTPEGEIIYKDSLAILDITNSWAQIKQNKNAVTEINFFTVPAIGLTYCMDIICRFQGKNKNYKIKNASVLNSVNSIVQALQYKNAIIFGAYYDTQRHELSLLAERENIIIHELFRSEGSFYCNEGNALLYEQPITLKTLKNVKIIISHLMDNSKIIQFLNPQNITYVDNLSQIMVMLSKDENYVSFFSSLLSAYPNAIPANIVKLDAVPDLIENLNYGLIYPKKLCQIPEIKVFIDFIENYCKCDNA